MTRPLAFQTLRATRLVAFIIAALAVPQASYALEPLGNTSCGQLGQPTCTIDTGEWWDTGTTTGCDRGLNSELRWPELRTYCVNGSRESAPVSAWASKALRLQRELQASLPLNQLTVLGAHNAFNNSSDGYIIPNQQYSITDQLRMGIRSLSIDIHWYNNALRLCHGTMEYGVPHLVCSLQDRPYFQIIEELNQWMRKPENSQEVVFLELEAYTDGHDAELIAPIHAYVSDLVFRPSMMPEGGLPTLQDIRAQGKRLILTGVQDGGADLFIERMDKWPSYGPSFIKNFVASSCSYNNNGTLTGMDSLYRNTLLRYGVNEDSVVMPFWNGPEEVGVITNETLRQLTACNVTGISLDQVTPDKIQNAIWSWNVDEPNNAENEDCAEMSSMGRWRDTQCGEIRRFACRHNQDPARWRITVSAGGWQQGASQCASEYPGYQFAVPRNGHENKKLVAAADGVPVWMNLNDIATEGLWSRSGPQASTVELFSLGKCITDSSGQASNNATLQLWECTGGLNQKWILAEDGTIRSAINTSKCLDLANSNTSNGNNIVVYDCNNGGNQRWIVDGPVLRSALKRSKVFDVNGGNTANGTRIQIWDYNGGGGQQWTQVRR